MKTAHEAIAAMKAELGRQINEERDGCKTKLYDFAKTRLGVLEELKDFLDTLEAEEQPKRTINFMAGHKGNLPLGTRTMWYEAFKEIELEKYVNERVEEIFPQQDNDFLSQEDLRKVIRKTAEHFLDRGCRRTAVMYDDIEFERQMEEEALPKIHGWAAKDKDGTILFSTGNKPIRQVDGTWDSWDDKWFSTKDNILPDLKWKDDPIEVELIINRKNSK